MLIKIILNFGRWRISFLKNGKKNAIFGQYLGGQDRENTEGIAPS